MKTKIYFFALTVISVFGLQAQTIMNIHQSNGTILQIPLNTIDSITYTIPNPGNLATLTTTASTFITETTAVSGGNITNDGGSLITQRGVCYSTNPSPTTANTTIISGSGTGTFTSTLTGLTANTTYYVRAYGTNSAGIAYGNEESFTTNAGGIITNPGAGVTFDGYTYSSIVIGNGQEWMAENLRTTIYSNGDPIPNVQVDSIWGALITGAWVNFNNDNQYETTFGKLYNWYTVSDSRNVCPTGWHVPTDNEWTDLTDYLGGQSVAGGKMKSLGILYWTAPNGDATNESGFSGLPAGFRENNNSYSSLNTNGYFWSSTENTANPGTSWYRVLGFDSGFVGKNGLNQKYGISIRCLKD